MQVDRFETEHGGDGKHPATDMFSVVGTAEMLSVTRGFSYTRH